MCGVVGREGMGGGRSGGSFESCRREGRRRSSSKLIGRSVLIHQLCRVSFLVKTYLSLSSSGDLPPLYFPHPPTIDLTPLAFPYSKLHLSETFPDSSTTATNTCGPPFLTTHLVILRSDSLTLLSAISIIGSSPERIAQTGITVVGSAVKRDAEGGPLSEKARSRISKLEMMRLVLKIRGLEGDEVS